MNTPDEALQQIQADYETYRIHATLSLSPRRKRVALSGLEHTLSECKRAVAGARSAGQGTLTTSWRQVEEFVRAQCSEIRMWLFLNDGKMHAAWSALMEAQSAAHWAVRWLPDFEPALHIEDHLAQIERVIFPRQQFLSPSMIIQQKDVECSVCHERGGGCDHIAGEVYDGEVAANIIHHIEGVREISLVDSPANKYARAFQYDNIDLLTGEVVKKGGGKRRSRKSPG